MRTAQPRSQGRDFIPKPQSLTAYVSHAAYPAKLNAWCPAVNDQSLTNVFPSRTSVQVKSSVQVKLLCWLWRDTLQRSHDHRNPKTNTKTYPTGLLSSANFSHPYGAAFFSRFMVVRGLSPTSSRIHPSPLPPWALRFALIYMITVSESIIYWTADGTVIYG